MNVSLASLSNDVCFYRQSLQEADSEIRSQYETGKALKDIIGLAFESHRKRVWEYFGFEVSKDRHFAMFDVDWSITYNGVLIAFEESKGHYVDSCFMERALTGFCKTVNTYQKQGREVPVLILHSFTRYNKFNEKLIEDMDTRKDAIRDEILKKLVYTTLVDCDRLPKKRWFSKDNFDCYSGNASDDLIIRDIGFIRSLVPVPVRGLVPGSGYY
jgi:hypothetical protein